MNNCNYSLLSRTSVPIWKSPYRWVRNHASTQYYIDYTADPLNRLTTVFIFIHLNIKIKIKSLKHDIYFVGVIIIFRRRSTINPKTQNNLLFCEGYSSNTEIYLLLSLVVAFSPICPIRNSLLVSEFQNTNFVAVYLLINKRIWFYLPLLPLSMIHSGTYFCKIHVNLIQKKCQGTYLLYLRQKANAQLEPPLLLAKFPSWTFLNCWNTFLIFIFF